MASQWAITAEHFVASPPSAILGCPEAIWRQTGIKNAQFGLADTADRYRFSVIRAVARVGHRMGSKFAHFALYR